MEIEFKDDTIIFNKDFSMLNDFVIDFTNIVTEHNVKYVIVSGYVAILFGRSRIREDARYLFKLFEHEISSDLLNMFLNKLDISKKFADKYLGRLV